MSSPNEWSYLSIKMIFRIFSFRKLRLRAIKAPGSGHVGGNGPCKIQTQDVQPKGLNPT